MSQINLKSITGITSITTPAGVDNVFTVHTNDTTERFRIDQTGNQSIAGILTVSQDLDVDGHTNLDNVSIAGVTTFSDNDIHFKNNGITSCRYDSDLGRFNFNHSGGLQWYKNGNLSNSSGAMIFYSEFANQYKGLVIHAPWQGQNNAKNVTVMGSSNGRFYVQHNLNAQETFSAYFEGGVHLGYYQSGTKLSTTTTGIRLYQDLTVDRNALITGISTFTGAIDANGDLDVDGHTNLDNVSVAGVSTFSGVVRVPNGSAAAPAIHFGDSDSGLYGDASNGVRITAGGSDRIVATSNGVTFPPKATALTSFTLGSQSALSKPLYFADAASVESASILLDNSSQELRIKNGRFSGEITFTTYNAEKLRILSNGHLRTQGNNNGNPVGMELRNNNTAAYSHAELSLTSQNATTSKIWCDVPNAGMRLQYNGGTTVKINQSGNLVMANDSGIDFSSETNEGSTSQNALLADYEEGVWTPTNTIGMTLTVNNGAHYIKIGKQVTVWFDITLTGNPDSAQCSSIENLPYVSKSSNTYYGQSNSVWYSNTNNAKRDYDDDNTLIFVNNNSTTIRIWNVTSGHDRVRSWANGRRFRGTVTYIAKN